ncbi:TPM domain-containing protein [Desulfosediminicola flagellatus]|uniref:TPM domain-containing protein n=1 Tax=Desulfosediminicola flagellatus TaxID=2569541 RepID=UPI0010AD9C6C|nr:TPM domain-containing protein [Desulfosediminicola flagellatus]
MSTLTHRQFLRGLFLLLFALLLPAADVSALEVPPLSGRVNDYAKILSSSTVRQLEGSLQSFETAQSTQIVVLTIPSLEGEVLEEFSIRVGETWKIGHQGLDNGAILIISRSDRKLRIEVGYGLEGSLTDLVSGRIIRNVILPQFKNGNFDQGVIDGVSAMMAAVNGEFSAKEVNSSPAGSDEETGFTVMLIACLFFVGKAFGRSKPLAATIGGIVSPLLCFFILGPKWLIIAAMVPVGIVGGLIASVLAAARFSAGSSGYRGSRSHGGSGSSWGGGFGGGTGGGGFGGGGGGFGGGGASGGW